MKISTGLALAQIVLGAMLLFDDTVVDKERLMILLAGVTFTYPFHRIYEAIEARSKE